MRPIEEKLVKYQEKGLFLKPHHFHLPIEIVEIFENLVQYYGGAVIFEGNHIYDIPVKDPYSYQVHEGKQGYLTFLKEWIEALEGSYEAYLDGEYFEDQEDLAIYHEECGKQLENFIKTLSD